MYNTTRHYSTTCHIPRPTGFLVFFFYTGQDHRLTLSTGTRAYSEDRATADNTTIIIIIIRAWRAKTLSAPVPVVGIVGSRANNDDDHDDDRFRFIISYHCYDSRSTRAVSDVFGYFGTTVSARSAVRVSGGWRTRGGGDGRVESEKKNIRPAAPARERAFAAVSFVVVVVTAAARIVRCTRAPALYCSWNPPPCTNIMADYNNIRRTIIYIIIIQ